jgi:hypothetical protein
MRFALSRESPPVTMKLSRMGHTAFVLLPDRYLSVG